MQVTETSADGLKREFKIVLSAKDIEEKVEDRLREIGRQVRIPGFRPGKVPVGILKQRFGDSVLGEVLDRALADSSEQALSERGLTPALQPKIEITSFERNQDLEYTLAVELMPEIEPMNFSELELERLVPVVGDKEVEEALEKLAANHKRSEPIAKPRKSRKGDVLVIDFKGYVDGEPFPGGEAEGHHLELGSGSFIEGFEDQLIGLEPGEKTEVKVTFPKEYGNERLAGREATFEVTVREIRESVPYKVDDELAKVMGMENIEALRAAVRRQIEQDYENLARSRLKRQLLDVLAERHDFPVPQGMVDLEFEEIWRQVEESREKGELDPADQGKSEEELRAEYRQIGERRVRLGLLMSETGRRNNITVTNEEIERALLEEARRHVGHEREFLERVKNDPQALASVRAPIFEGKVIDFILEMAKVTDREVPAEDLLKVIMEEDTAGAEAKPARKAAAGKKATAKKTAKGKAKGGKTETKAARAAGKKGSRAEDAKGGAKKTKTASRTKAADTADKGD